MNFPYHNYYFRERLTLVTLVLSGQYPPHYPMAHTKLHYKLSVLLVVYSRCLERIYSLLTLFKESCNEIRSLSNRFSQRTQHILLETRSLPHSVRKSIVQRWMPAFTLEYLYFWLWNNRLWSWIVSATKCHSVHLQLCWLRLIMNSVISLNALRQKTKK